MGAKRSGSGRRLPALIGAGAASLALPAGALACPRCATSDVVWAMAFGPELWPSLLATVSPFAVLAAVTVVCYRVGARRGAGRQARS
jgi:hypothetical protein